MSRSRLLITSGPTREYLDPVRYLSNGSSGRMGSCLAESAIEAGFEVTIISGPVQVKYPDEATLIKVTSAEEMLEQVLLHWPNCDGLIAAAAPSDFRPQNYSSSKLKKSERSDRHTIELVKTPDILAEAGRRKNTAQRSIGFALETENGVENAKLKMAKKNCDFIVLNDPSAIDSSSSNVSIISQSGEIIAQCSGTKAEISVRIVSLIDL